MSKLAPAPIYTVNSALAKHTHTSIGIELEVINKISSSLDSAVQAKHITEWVNMSFQKFQYMSLTNKNCNLDSEIIALQA